MNHHTHKNEHPSTYFVEDRSSKDDLARLQLQDRMLTTAMGGVLAEQPDASRFRHVLDVGCGTGGWLIEVARAYPTIQTLFGVDISSYMVAFARSQAQAAGVYDRVEFLVMDALRRLEFPSGYFDLVNQRSGASYLRTWDWPHLLQEYQRVTRIGGMVRLTEGEWGAESNSQALTQLFDLLMQAFSLAGHSFTPQRDGVTGALEEVLHRQGYTSVQQRVIRTDYRAGTAAGDLFREDMSLTLKILVPFLHKWGGVPDTYERWCQQALYDMQQPDFHASGQMLTVWGITSAQSGIFFH
jgi:ubiquinone/menaquinone biosynthesis C-methylase UbiE